MQNYSESILSLDVLDKLIKLVSGYRSTNGERCVFRSISDTFYRENFHSDLLKYYLEEPLAKQKLIAWLNEGRIPEDYLHFSDYEYGKLGREEGRIDVLLLSNDGKQAIIIENKSNEAGDQPQQLPRYVKVLRHRNCEPRAILYLTRSTSMGAYTNGWTEYEIKSIGKLTLNARLVGSGSFTEKVIDQVLLDSNDIRLSGLSLEIKKLFQILVFGELNMSTLAHFAIELQKGNNYKDLTQIIRAYNDLPVFWRNECAEKLDELFRNRPDAKPVKLIRYAEACLLVKHIMVRGKLFSIDMLFSHDGIKFSLAPEKLAPDEIDELKDQFGAAWPFSMERIKWNDEQRYAHLIENPFPGAEVLDYLARLFVTFGLLPDR